jgi:hypothetical protein
MAKASYAYQSMNADGSMATMMAMMAGVHVGYKETMLHAKPLRH